MSNVRSIIVISASLGASALWGVYGLTGLAGLTSYAFKVCHDLVSSCLEYASLAKMFFIWSGAGLASGGVVYAAVKGALKYLDARRGLRGLPLTSAGSISVIEDKDALSAFTCGILRPKVYMTRGLLRALDPGERRAVLLHELHHKKNLDTLRFAALEFLKDAFFYLPLAGYVAASLRAKREKEADDSAAAAMKEGVTLASALVKVAASGSSFSFAQTSFAGADPAARIRRILSGKEEPLKRPPLKAFAASVIMAAFIAAALIFPAISGAGTGCTKDHCELHSERAVARHAAGQDSRCETHCAAPMPNETHGAH